MRRKPILNAILAGLMVLATASAGQRIQGWCEKGGQAVNVVGYLSSAATPVQRSYPSCTVTVYVTGSGGTLASIYSDSSGGTLHSNPFTADSTGHWYFYLSPSGQHVDVQISGTGLTPFTLLADVGSYTTVYNVKDYGAKGDATTDDTTAINAAITYVAANGCGTVFFPPGVYMVSTTASTVAISLASCVDLQGESTDSSIIRLKNATLNHDLILGSAINNVTISNLTIDQNNAPTVTAGYAPVACASCTYFTLKDSAIINMDFHGLGLSAGSNNDINHNVFSRTNPWATCTGTATTSGTTVTRVSGCSFGDWRISAGGGSMWINSGMYSMSSINSPPGTITITPSTTTQTSPVPFIIQVGGGISFSAGVQKSYFRNNYLYGLDMDMTVIDSEISGNIIDDMNYGSGIVTECDYRNRNSIIRNNHIFADASSPVYSTASCIETWGFAYLVEGNICHGQSGPGIDVGGQGSIVANNIAYDNGQLITISPTSTYSGFTARASTPHTPISAPLTYSSGCLSCDYCTFSNNSAYNDIPATGTQYYGFRVETAGGYTSVGVTSVGNSWQGSTAGAPESIPAGVSTFAESRPQFSGAKSWTPGTITNGSRVTTTTTVTGAQLGSQVTAGFSLDLQGATITAYVNAADTVTLVIQNSSGSSVTLGAGTAFVTVTLPQNYANY